MPQHPLQGSQPCPGEGACVPQWSSEPGHAGLPKTDRSQWRILTKRGLQEEEMVIHSSVLAVKTPWAVWKVKKMISEYTPHPTPKLVSVWYATGEEWRAPERMKQLGQSGNDAQLWMCLVVKIKSDVVKNNIAEEPGMLGPWIKVNWMWSSKRCQEWTSASLGISEENGWERVNLI